MQIKQKLGKREKCGKCAQKVATTSLAQRSKHEPQAERAITSKQLQCNKENKQLQQTAATTNTAQ